MSSYLQKMKKNIKRRMAKNRPQYRFVETNNPDAEDLPTPIETDGIIFQVKHVRLSNMADGRVKLSYDYELIEGVPDDVDAFEKKVGDIVVDVLEYEGDAYMSEGDFNEE